MKKTSGVFCLCLLFIVSACQTTDVWIKPTDDVDMEGMRLYWQRGNLAGFPDDEDAKISVYIRADKDSNGEWSLDDGQEWLALLETSLGNYPIFPRRHIQLGRLLCSVLNEYRDDGTILHIVVAVEQGAGYRVYTCSFDADKKAFLKTPLYETRGNFSVLCTSY